MMKFKNIFLGLCIAAASLNTFAQQSDEHKDHHPEKTAPSAVTIKQTVTSTTATDKMAAMDQHMKAMQAMHEKMMAAKTPQERQKLMAEHMKLMQGGMSMMKQMGSQSMNANMADRQQMMEKRMDMMQSMMQFMMQMMMDCMPPSATK